MMPIDYHHNNHLYQGPGQCSQCVTVINVRSSPGHTLQVSLEYHDHNDHNRDNDNDLEDNDDNLEDTPFRYPPPPLMITMIRIVTMIMILRKHPTLINKYCFSKDRLASWGNHLMKTSPSTRFALSYRDRVLQNHPKGKNLMTAQMF